MPIDEKEITSPQLLGTEQPRKRADEISLNGALQVARSVSLIAALFKQVRHAEPEGPRRTIQHPLLDLPQFDLQPFIQFVTL